MGASNKYAKTFQDGYIRTISLFVLAVMLFAWGVVLFRRVDDDPTEACELEALAMFGVSVLVLIGGVISEIFHIFS